MIQELVRKLKGVAVLHAIDAPHKLPYDETLRAWDAADGRVAHTCGQSRQHVDNRVSIAHTCDSHNRRGRDRETERNREKGEIDGYIYIYMDRWVGSQIDR